jgi:transcriptional regulator with XRE-family HTH domain
MSAGFGARMRRRREEQGIALLTIAGHTKIKLSLLEGLERDDVSQWPSGIFRRAYIRSYAQAIGLDPDVVAGEFLDAYPEPGEVVTTEAMVAVLDGARPGAAPPTRLRCMVGSALGSLARLRRSSPVAHVGVADAAPVTTASRRHEADLPLAVDPSPELWQVEQPLQADTDAASGEMRASTSDAGLPGVAPPVLEREQFHDFSDVVESGDVAGSGDMAGSGEVVEDTAQGVASAPVDPDFSAVAALCTELGRAGDPDAVQLSLQQAARVLDATGLIIWLWDRWADGLRPTLVHGYADALVSQLPIVRSDADNVTAAAFRSGRTCTIDGGPHASGALAVPLLTSDGCAGVLAIELQHGRAQMTSVRAAATILAAQLAPLAGRPWREESGPESELRVPVDEALM